MHSFLREDYLSVRPLLGLAATYSSNRGSQGPGSNLWGPKRATTTPNPHSMALGTLSARLSSVRSLTVWLSRTQQTTSESLGSRCVSASVISTPKMTVSATFWADLDPGPQGHPWVGLSKHDPNIFRGFSNTVLAAPQRAKGSKKDRVGSFGSGCSSP